MTNDQPRDPTGDQSNGRIRSRATKDGDLEHPPGDEPILPRAESKAEHNLSRTLEAIRISIDKGRMLVELGEQRFREDWIVQDAAISVVTQLAEEVKRLPKSFKDARPDIAWHKVVGMRNVVTHEYTSVDLSTIWIALDVDFPNIDRSVFGDQL